MQERAPFDVCILQSCVPHYRVRFFQELSRRLEGRLVLAAGPHGYGHTPQSEPTPGVSRVELNNWFLGSSLVVQSGLPDSVLRAAITVVPFNPRELSALWTLVRRRWKGRPVVLWGHGLSPRKDSPRWIRRLRRWMAAQAQAVILYNQKGRQEMEKLGVPARKLFVALNAVDVGRVQQVAGSQEERGKDLLSVGRLVPGKGYDLVLEAFAKALPDLPAETRLILIGEGSERVRLTAQARALGVSPRVELPGEITEEERLAPYFARSLLSVYGGPIGLFAIHSLAYGVPLLVADDEPHNPEAEVLVPGQNCAYFRARDRDSLARELVSLMAQPEKLRGMGQRGRARVTADYSLDRMCEAFLDAFELAVGAPNVQERNTAPVGVGSHDRS